MGHDELVIRFGFELRPVASIAPWTDGKGADPHLSWFGLTDGWYWIDVDGSQLFRYSESTLNRWRADGFDAQRPFASYQVARLWEDVQELLPAVLQPVPADLEAFVASDQPWKIDVEEEGRIDEAYTWHAAHALSSGHLLGPRIRAWRSTAGNEDRVTLVWTHERRDAEEKWYDAPERGETRIATQAFIDAVHDFDRRLIAAMRERVDHVESAGIDPTIRVDRVRLREEQQERSTWLDRALACDYPTDWSAVRIGAPLLMGAASNSRTRSNPQG